MAGNFMLNGLGVVIMVIAALLLAWTGRRAWQVKNRAVRWGGVALAAPASLAVAAVAGLAILGLVKLEARRAPVPELAVAGTPEQVRRGQAIADSFCAACHAPNGPLTGDVDIGKELAVPVGSFVSANLTPTGPLRNWSDGEIFRAIRNDLDAEGHWLTIMSYTNAGRLSDDDIAAVIAYLRRQAPAGRATPNPPDRINLLGVIMLGAGLLPGGNPVVTGTITAPPKGPTRQYGEYILSYQDCRSCHGANLTGGVEGQIPPLGPDLNLVKYWKLPEFVATLRTGVDPGGHELSRAMPWQPIGKMDDDELKAVYEYLTHMPDE